MYTLLAIKLQYFLNVWRPCQQQPQKFSLYYILLVTKAHEASVRGKAASSIEDTSGLNRI